MCSGNFLLMVNKFFGFENDFDEKKKCDVNTFLWAFSFVGVIYV